MNKHYVCTNCGGESFEPKVCNTENCGKAGQPLSACECGDGLHQAVMQKNETSNK